jgi:hypothetical protein
MKTLSGIEEAKAVIGEFQLSEFRIIRELRFYETETHSPCLEMTVESEERSPSYQLKLVFTGVRSLRLREFGGKQTRIIGLDVTDISERNWENVCWQVMDYEDDNLNFLAKTATIVSFHDVTEKL